MRLLYVASGHPLQEADDCLMWQKLGIEWVSTGYYSLSDKPGDLPYINRPNTELLTQLFTQDRWTDTDDKPDRPGGQKNLQWTGQVVFNRWGFRQSFIDNFDAVFFNHFVENVDENLRACKGKKIFLKTYSMHDIKRENTLASLRKRGLIVVRNSPKEHLRGKYAGHDAIIRGSVVRDEYELNGWTGVEKKVCTFTSYMDGFTEACINRKNLYEETCSYLSPYGTDLYGIGSRFITHIEKLKILQDYRVNLVTGTPNANNTYSFVEAWIMGQPIVVFGRDMWQSASYEADELIVQGKTGFVGNTPHECAKYIRLLMQEDDLAAEISRNSRDAAIKIYGRDTLAEQWKQLFRTYGLYNDRLQD